VTAEPAVAEERRLAALRRYGVLDTPAEQAFDDLALLAQHLCGTPVAAVSLVDADRQWFKARIGLEVTETARDIAFCHHTVMAPDRVFEVEDAERDPRFAGGPLVTAEPQIRFYAGAPLVTPDGFALGAICVMDRRPRTLTDVQRVALAALSRRVVAQLELGRRTRDLEIREREAQEMLALAEQSRRALLSVLEDEKRAGRSLRASEELFRQAVENIREVFWTVDATTGRILYVSPGYRTVWGRSPESLSDSPTAWSETIHEEDRARVLQAAQAHQASGTYDETYRIVRPDGTLRWVRDQAFPVRDEAGKVTRIVGVAEDITQRKQLEERFLRAQRLEAVGTLASGIAHDLNNILTPMLMVASLLKKKLPDPRDTDLLALVEQGAQRGANIIRQLLTFSRGIEGNRGPVQPRHLLKEMESIMRETFPRELVLGQKVPADLWPIVADATQIHQVLMNLCVNARDAMRRGGRLTLAAHNLVLGEAETAAQPPAKPGPFVRLTVADTGEGIPRENLDRIFEPFFTTKEIGQGTGLGLSTVLGIVHSHGGFVTVDSEPGRGSAFHVHLPAAAGSGDTPPPAAAVPAPGSGETILVVDDEPAIRSTIGFALAGSNYRVLAAADGREAMTLFLKHRDSVRLVFTDLMMPGVNGFALIRSLRALAPGLRFVAASGLTDPGRREELAALGVTALLAKPCSADDVRAAVARELAAGCNRGSLRVGR
jgi:PAS domain S-box-containing protein